MLSLSFDQMLQTEFFYIPNNEGMELGIIFPSAW